MNFIHYDLGRKERGEIIEITFSGSAANVRLMDSSNFQSFRNGRNHRYTGGLIKSSPIRLYVPSSGQYHVTVDMQGLRGTARSSVRTLPRALPGLRQPSLASVPSLVHKDYFSPDEEEHIEREFDIFISHASEDKDEVVRPLLQYEMEELKLKKMLKHFFYT